MASGFSATRTLTARLLRQNRMIGQARQGSLEKKNILVRFNTTEASHGGGRKPMGLVGITGVFLFFGVCLLGIPTAVGVDVGRQARKRAAQTESEIQQ